MSTEWWTRVLTDGHGQITKGRDRVGERYLLLPRARDPRVVVDAESPAALDDALRRSVQVRSMTDAARAAICRIGPALVRRQMGWTVEGGDGSTLRHELSDILGIDVRLSISVGPPRPNRKPVVRCWSGAELVAIAKIGPDPHTAAMVRNEAEWLGRLHRDGTGELVIPELLHARPWGTGELIVMSALRLLDDGRIPIDDMPTTTLHQLIDRDDHREGLDNSSWWESLTERLAEHDDPVVSDALARARDDRSAGHVQLGTWHGDWSPWNVGRSADGHWAIWDWERTATGVPRGFDLLHLHHQYGAGLNAADAAIRGRGIPEEHLQLLRRLYLLELVARHHEAGATGTARHLEVRQLLIDDADGAASTDLRGPGVRE